MDSSMPSPFQPLTGSEKRALLLGLLPLFGGHTKGQVPKAQLRGQQGLYPPRTAPSPHLWCSGGRDHTVGVREGTWANWSPSYRKGVAGLLGDLGWATPASLGDRGAPLGICPREVKTPVHTNTTTWMFIVVLFVRAPNWRTRCPPMARCPTTWGTSATEHCSAANKQEQSTDTKPFGCTSW